MASPGDRRRAPRRLREATTVETVWAHGDLPAARGLARHLGLTRIRTLHLMSRPLTEAEVRPPAFPDGLTLRSFRDGDEDAWLAVNAAAFAHHPSRDAWTGPRWRS